MFQPLVVARTTRRTRHTNPMANNIFIHLIFSFSFSFLSFDLSAKLTTADRKM